MVKKYSSKRFNNKKTFRQLERIIKGSANHTRLQILALLEKEPELSVVDVAKRLDMNLKTISDHISVLARSGLVLKRSDFNYVRHKLTKNGESILEFCRITE